MLLPATSVSSRFKQLPAWMMRRAGHWRKDEPASGSTRRSTLLMKTLLDERL